MDSEDSREGAAPDCGSSSSSSDSGSPDRHSSSAGSEPPAHNLSPVYSNKTPSNLSSEPFYTPKSPSYSASTSPKYRPTSGDDLNPESPPGSLPASPPGSAPASPPASPPGSAPTSPPASPPGSPPGSPAGSPPRTPMSAASSPRVQRSPASPPQSPIHRKLSPSCHSNDNWSHKSGSPSRQDSMSPTGPAPTSPDPQSPSFPRKSPPARRSNEKWSPKSNSRSRQDSLSPGSQKSASSHRSAREQRRRERSDSSQSSRESSPRRRSAAAKDPPTEEISEGEMESDNDQEKPAKNAAAKEKSKSPKREKKLSESNVNISHEDLSDVSDLESMGQASDDEHRAVKKSPIRAPEQSDSRESPAKSEAKVNGNMHIKAHIKPPGSPPTLGNGTSVEGPKIDKITQEKVNKSDDAEEQLDFEAEEGECVEAPAPKASSENNGEAPNKDDDEGSGAASSLEEGEVSDEEERRPEETEPRPVCRFYSRGQCTWGISCRFLHPGVTDKGNYTMFDMVRAMPAGYSQHHAHHHGHAHQQHALHATRLELPPSESAWERGLRTAKEMMRKACKRKEQDSDFEEKKLHLSLAGAGRGGSLAGAEEDDPDLAAYLGSYLPPSSPTPAAVKRERERDDYYRQAERRAYEEAAVRAVYAPRERERMARGYRGEPAPAPLSPPHQRAPASPPPVLPGYYKQDKERLDRMDRLEERGPSAQAPQHKSRRGRTTREVIVQRAPGGGGGRAEEWADPWMRGGGAPDKGLPRDKRPSRHPPGPGRKYSSASSYSSSSSRSSNSSPRSGSPGRTGARHGLRSPMKQRLAALSPSVIVQERRAANARAVAMNPPAPSSRKRASSPAAARQHASNPPPPHHTKGGVDSFGRSKPPKPKQPRTRKHYSKSSSSGSDSSSSSSDSESESHSSSSSESSVGGRGAATTAGSAPHRGQPPLPDRKMPGKPGGVRQLSPKHSMSASQKKDAPDNDMRKDPSLSKKRGAVSPINSMVPAKKPVSRREELLKQLKAVEDAIARKRSKI